MPKSSTMSNGRVAIDSMYSLRRAVGHSLGQFIEQDVRFGVQHFVALQNGGLTDCLCQVAFPGSARAGNIMPMVSRSSRFITRFTHYTVRAFALNGGGRAP